MGIDTLLVIYNARIYTNVPEEPEVSAIAIQNGLVVATGKRAETLGRTRTSVTRIDLAGSVILPGLIDSHLHLEHYAKSLERIDCETPSLDICLQKVHDRAVKTPKKQWILGHGWNQNVWVEGFGNAEMLDRVASGHPVYLTAKSLHVSWANSVALKLAGINKNTPDPQGGLIERNLDGTPTGILFETAMSLVEKAIPEPSDEQVKEMISKAIPSLWQMGITGVHDFDQRRCFLALQSLNIQNKLQLRVVKSIPLENLTNAVETGLKTGYGNPFLSVGPVKLFADGALGPQTASMIQPYEGSPDNIGMLFLNADQIFEYGRQAARSGISLAIHAIGDRANHEVIDAYLKLREYENRNNLPALRHRIEHLQIVNPEDLRRLAKLDIIASMQPIHATSDMDIADRYLAIRSKNAYVFASLLNCGASLTFGSDAPVESPNPFWGIHAAVTRRRHNGKPTIAGWQPQQKISVQQAIQGYTTGPAFAAGFENTQGKLASGFWADLIVLKNDPFSVDPDELFQIKPVATMVAGEWVWQNFF